MKFYDFGHLGAGRGERVGCTEAAEQLVQHQLCGREDTARTPVTRTTVAGSLEGRCGRPFFSTDARRSRRSDGVRFQVLEQCSAYFLYV